MKDEKGFTLIELVAVILLITIIMFVTYPNFSNLNVAAKQKYDASTKVLIKSAASMYVNNNKEEIDTKLNESQIVCIPIGKLVAYEYLDSELKKADGTEMEYDSCINVSKNTENGKERYIYDAETTDKISSSIDYMPPVLVIRSLTESQCKKIMNVNSIDEFINKCRVEATDDKDGTITAKGPIQKIGKDSNRVFLEYNAVDNAGNNAVPLKIELIIQ